MTFSTAYYSWTPFCSFLATSLKSKADDVIVKSNGIQLFGNSLLYNNTEINIKKTNIIIIIIFN